MPIKFTLQETMNLYDITQKELSEASGVRMNTIKDLREGTPKSLTVEKLDDLITAINKMTNGNYGFEAVMEYVPSVEDSE